ncbi:HAD-IA family hydrolase [Loktanella sp. Alg231-35]|uniref:HAD-IA family hydrolase n=1 Tax=Loktanella sp. Alg231-35 TaxID=1922220 RepID=UPI000D55429F|nr:HAD-IA family hydrolase [Loktanella sp. Alg231-35]
MSDLRLVIFDVDGTLVDSQAEIVAAMTLAFQSENLLMPDRARVLSIVGLSLAEAFGTLCPQVTEAQRDRLVTAYKDAFVSLRSDNKEMGPLFPGAQAALERLQGQDHTLLAVATGKSRRGLDKVLGRHGLTGVFHSEQVADHHPSKPHPSMILTAMSETGVTSERAVMLGDTTYDMDMARAAGIGTIGVTWGYHPAENLHADIMIDDFAALSDAVDQLVGP